MSGKTLYQRMKDYEQSSDFHLPKRQAVMVRVDGRAFHTFTRGMDKPFDANLMDAMVHATVETARSIQGFKLAYTQSDEASFLLTDFDNLDSQGWFDYSFAKIVSLTASLFTAHFNMHLKPPKGTGLATFDSRAFVVPLEDAPNMFVCRQKDWFRNSLSMLAQSHFSHKQLHQKKAKDMHDMLHGIGVNWTTDLSEREKNGTFVLRDYTIAEEKADYTMIKDWVAQVPKRELMAG